MYVQNMSYKDWYEEYVDKGESKANQIKVNVKPSKKAEKSSFEYKFGSKYPKDIEDSIVKRIEQLGNKFPEVRKEFNSSGAVITDNNRLKRTLGQFRGYTSGKPISIEFGTQYKDLASLEQKVEELVERNFYMPASKQNYKNYIVTHEFGHAVENNIINMIAQGEADQAWAKTSYFRKLQENKIKSQIIKIARENNPNFRLYDNLSEYGGDNSGEFFAEAFANAFCGNPNELGKSMLQYLKGARY